MNHSYEDDTVHITTEHTNQEINKQMSTYYIPVSAWVSYFYQGLLDFF